MKRVDVVLLTSLTLVTGPAPAQNTELVRVIAKPLTRTVDLPGELQPFESVSIHARLRGYVNRVLVDRGSRVRKGQLLAVLTAPEMAAQLSEAESKVQAAESERAEAEARTAAFQSTYERLRKAAETPGAISGNELMQAQKQVEAAQALVQSKGQAVAAARAAARAEQDLQSYLRVTAPFDGVVTDRLVHPGALVGPGADPAMLVIQQVSRLRLVVAVPEENTGAIFRGVRVEFRVPAHPDRSYGGTVARISQSLDPKMRTMAVELDVANGDGSLAPGMYPSVRWPIRQPRSALVVPRTSVVTTTERTFVIRDRNGRAEWVDVVKGVSDGDLVEIRGNVHPGDTVVRRASDELRDGSPVRPVQQTK